MAIRRDQARSWGAPLWRAETALPRAELPAHSEVAVVGAGLTGLAAARVLARAGRAVHVLEAGRLADGASGRTGGIVLEDSAAGPLPGLEGCLPHLEERLAELGIDCALELGGCRELRHAAGDPSDRPGWPDEEGTRLVVAGEVPGGTVDPGALIAGLARAALAAGAVIHEGARVEALSDAPASGLRVGGRELRAERVILATNGFLPALAPELCVHAALSLAVATAPLPREALAAADLRAPFYTVDLPYLWGRATRDGRLVVGAGLVFDPEQRVERVRLASQEVRAGFARLERRLRGLHPALARVEVTHRWGGPVCFRASRTPLLCEPAPGRLATGAYAGHGLALALRVGEWAAAWALGEAQLPAWGRPGV